jgi:hypothetical protein
MLAFEFKNTLERRALQLANKKRLRAPAHFFVRWRV